MTPSPAAPEKTYTFVLIIWAVMFASVGMYYYLVRTVLQPPKTDPNPLLAYILLSLSILMVLASLYFRTRFGASEGQARTLAKVQAGYIIALAFAEAPALYGLVVFATSGWPQYWIFFSISVIAFILNFPRRDAFEQASP
ncbi:MAG: hypothetical protein HYX25_04295 [Candidatus Solibacter usitatus]|nr:hypothetical protein [Candidatus Solibacter usitatus]